MMEDIQPPPQQTDIPDTLSDKLNGYKQKRIADEAKRVIPKNTINPQKNEGTLISAMFGNIQG